MPMINKLVSALLALVVAMALFGCGEKEQTKSFSKAQNGVEMHFTYYYKDDRVLRQTARNTIPYATLNAANKDEAQKILAPLSQQYQNIAGLTEKVEYQDTFAIETLDVDYSKADLKTLSQMPGSSFQMNDSNWVSMKNSEALLTGQGFSEVK